MNCQSIKNKKAELQTIIDSAKPDIILGNESWLTPDIKNSEIFPDSFDALYLGSFYRPPDKIDNDYLEEFISSLSRIMSNRNAHVLVGGDFNCGDIEWSHMQVPHGVQKRQSQQQLLDIIGEHCLTQVVNIPTRNDKTHDLLLTNAPSPVNRVKGMPPIGKADHDIVYVEYDIRLKE